MRLFPEVAKPSAAPQFCLTIVTQRLPSSVPSPAPQALRPETRLPALDGLRGVAILAVLVCHFPQRPLNTSPVSEWFVYRVLSRGEMGVDLFFSSFWDS